MRARAPPDRDLAIESILAAGFAAAMPPGSAPSLLFSSGNLETET